jgi:chromosome segregation ATPase
VHSTQKALRALENAKIAAEKQLQVHLERMTGITESIKKEQEQILLSKHTKHIVELKHSHEQQFEALRSDLMKGTSLIKQSRMEVNQLKANLSSMTSELE